MRFNGEGGSTPTLPALIIKRQVPLPPTSPPRLKSRVSFHLTLYGADSSFKTGGREVGGGVGGQGGFQVQWLSGSGSFPDNDSQHGMRVVGGSPVCHHHQYFYLHSPPFSLDNLSFLLAFFSRFIISLCASIYSPAAPPCCCSLPSFHHKRGPTGEGGLSL